MIKIKFINNLLLSKMSYQIIMFIPDLYGFMVAKRSHPSHNKRVRSGQMQQSQKPPGRGEWGHKRKITDY